MDNSSDVDIRLGDIDETTGIIDFEDIKNKRLHDAGANAGISTAEKSKSFELFPESDDPTRNLQFPLVSSVAPPSKIPKHHIKEMWFQAPWYVNLRCRFLASEYPPFQCGTIQGFLGLFHERMRHLTSFPYMIHPYSDFITWWNFFVGFCLALNIIYSPYLIAFNVNFFVQTPTLALNLFMTAVLLLDILLNFVTGIRDDYSGNVIFDPRVVMWRYLKGWFLFDLITRTPIDAILTLQLTKDEKAIKTNLEAIRIIALVTRTFRYRKMYEILSRISEILSFRSIIYPWVLKLVILILYCVHWMACFHWLLPDIVNARYDKPKPNSWVTAYNLWNKSEFEQYINAYLRSLSNLLTLDGGSFIPRETEDIFCTIIGIFLNISLFGYFISSFTTIMGQLNASTEKFEHTFDMIHDYLTFKKIPVVLQEKVLTYFEKKHRGHMFSDAAIMATLSPSLRIELACHNCRTLIEKVPIFQQIPAGVVVSLAEKLEYDVYVPGDVLVTAETQGDAMYFIQSGEVHILDFFGSKITNRSITTESLHPEIIDTEERMDMFEYFAKQRILEDKRRREAKEYLTRKPLTPEVVHLSTLLSTPGHVVDTDSAAINNSTVPLPFPIGSRDYLIQSKIVQCMKSKWEEKMRLSNLPLAIPKKQISVSQSTHMPTNQETKPLKIDDGAKLFVKLQVAAENNLKSQSRPQHMSIATQTSSDTPLADHEIPQNVVKNCTETRNALEKCTIHQIKNCDESLGPSINVNIHSEQKNTTSANINEHFSESHQSHPHTKRFSTSYPRKDRNSILPLKESVQGLLSVVEHHPHDPIPPSFPRGSFNSPREKGQANEFETNSYVTRINSGTDMSTTNESKEYQAASSNIQHRTGETYSIVSSEQRIFDENDELLINKHKFSWDQSTNSRRESDFDDDKSSIALEVEGPFPRRATINKEDEIILHSLAQDFDHTVQQEVETKSDQVFNSKSEVNMTNNNGEDVKALLTASLSKESLYYTAISMPESESVGKRSTSSTLMRTRSYEVCHNCRKLIKPGDATFEINGVHHIVWHQRCFTCKLCQIQLGYMDHLFFEGEPYCYRHYAVVAHVPKCHACGELIFDPSYTSAAGCFWHKDHFVCQSCRVPLVDTKYIGVHGHVFCFRCHEQEYMKVCEACHEKILPREVFVQSGQYFWHSNSNCLHCETCQRSLVGHSLFFRRDKKLFCNRYCAMSRDMSM